LKKGGKLVSVVTLLTAPWWWASLAGVALLIYGFSGRLAYIDIIGVIKHYKEVFTKTKDFIFFIAFPLLLAISSTLYSSVDDELSSLMAVVLSILTSMVLTFMAMTNDRYKSSVNKPEKNLGDLQLKARNKDALAVGVYEILLSILVLILIFVLPIVESNRIAQHVMSFFIYYGFYSFLLNVFIIVRRLFQIYFNK
jgi:hypothetical protein